MHSKIKKLELKKETIRKLHGTDFQMIEGGIVAAQATVVGATAPAIPESMALPCFRITTITRTTTPLTTTTPFPPVPTTTYPTTSYPPSLL